MFTNANVVSSYTRAQAINDGVLVDCSSLAREAGFRVPLAMTAAVWHSCVAWTDDNEQDKPMGQSEVGRLWDVLWMALLAAKRTEGDRAPFTVLRVPREGAGVSPQPVELVLHIG
ncbi:hypothetical protein ABD76_00145, partial [Paenibacillus dendritiformis]|uniref:DUF6573 family protein n=1 Tax=Paenibacillus dendritiformis TaxID=130049 RepID=UPI002A11B69A|nr:hypothetical protein [Paenibacillus dendritiformis]